MRKQTIATTLMVALAIPSWAAQNSPQNTGQTPSANAQPQSETTAAQKRLSDEIHALSGLPLSATPNSNDPCSAGLQILRPAGPNDSQILVEEPKIYDDAVMQQQLEANFSRLAALSGFDQASLTSHLGNVTGVNQSFASGSFTVQGPATSQTVNTVAVPTQQTQATNTVSSGTAASNGISVPVTTTQGVNETTSNSATNQTATTQPSVTVPTAAPQAVAPVATTGFSVQSSAILSEQLQLASRLSTEILADEGALSDRVVTGNFFNPITQTTEPLFTTIRPTATVGFDITVAPNQRKKDAAAVVEAIVANCGGAEIDSRIPPAITALIPSEATYNVAAVRNTAMNLGGGVATAFLGASGSFLFGHNQYFLVQDEDTLAQVFRPIKQDRDAYCGSKDCVGIRWILRPVLGQRFVGEQRRKVVVQLAFPSFASSSQYGELTVRTSWRHFDRKTGLLGNALKDSEAILYHYPVGNIPVGGIHSPVLSAESTQDLGNGQIMVTLSGGSLSGTYVRVGSQILVDPPSGLTRELDSLRFIVSASDLMTKDVYLVSRSGDMSPLVNARASKIFVPIPANGASMTPVTIGTLDSANSRVTVSYCEIPDPNRKPDASAFARPLDPTLLLIGGKVYGLSDAPLARTNELGAGASCPKVKRQDKTDVQTEPRTLALTLPTAGLLASPVITMKRMFEGPDQTFQFPLTGNTVSPMSQTDRLVLLAATKDSAQFLLYGSGLKQVDAGDKGSVDPPVALAAIPGPAASDTADTMRYVSLTKDQLAQYKFLVITRKNQAPEAIAIPAVTLPDSGGAPTVTSTVLKGDDEAVVTGTGLNTLIDVQFENKSVQFIPAKDAKSPVTLLHLRRAGVTSRTSLQSLDFYFKQGPVKVKMDVFSGLVQTSARPDAPANPPK